MAVETPVDLAIIDIFLRKAEPFCEPEKKFPQCRSSFSTTAAFCAWFWRYMTKSLLKTVGLVLVIRLYGVRRVGGPRRLESTPDSTRHAPPAGALKSTSGSVSAR